MRWRCGKPNRFIPLLRTVNEIPVKRLAWIWGLAWVVGMGHVPLQASHLVGGTATYQYLGQVGGLYRFRVKFLIYRDCNSSTAYDAPMYVGVYERGPSSPYTLLRIDSLNPGPVLSVEPVSSAGCDFEPNVCLERTVYEKDIYLPPSAYGYVITYVRCCRNDPDNMMPDMGQTYVVEIPPTNILNSSPTFADLPIPYFCTGDTVSLDWSATDPDGDVLRYELAHPYHGASTSDPRPTPTQTYSWPPPLVTYQPNYSATDPFGPNGTASIDSITGQLDLHATAPGAYVIAVDVKEYRNGQLIGTVRRDMQVLVLACPPNRAPVLTSVNNGPPTYSFEIFEGESWSATFRYADTDSLVVEEISGEIFNAAPPATYSLHPGNTAPDTLTLSVLWNTVCGQARNTPYTFKVKVRDKGCPAKVVDHLFSVRVKRFEAAAALEGPSAVCDGEEVWVRAVNPRPGVTYHWAVSGAALLVFNADTAVRIRLVNPSGTTQPATVSVWASNAGGCISDTLTLQIQVGPRPPAYNFPSLVTVCDGETVRLGDSSMVRPGYSYRWMPTQGLDDPFSPTPLLTLSFDSSMPVDVPYVLATTTDAGCVVWDTVVVRVYPLPRNDTIRGPDAYCVGGLFHHSVDPMPGDRFRWFVQGGIIVGDSTRSDVAVVWTDSHGVTLHVEITNYYGCSKVATKSLTPYVPRPDSVLGRRVVCPNTSKRYWVIPNPGSQYYWRVENGTIVGGSTGSRILVRWGNGGPAAVYVVEVTKEGCIGDTVKVPIVLSYTLQTPPIEGPDTLCLPDDPVGYWVPPALGSVFDWSVAGDLFLVSGQGTDSVTVKFNSPGGHQIKVFERAYDSVNHRWCYGDTVRKNVWVYPVPEPLFFFGDSLGCTGRTATFVAFIGGNTDSVQWGVHPYAPLDKVNDSLIRVSWVDTGRFRVYALPVSPDGCVGPGDSLDVAVYPTPPLPTVEGARTVCLPDSAQAYFIRGGNSISAFPPGALRYYWSVEGGRWVDSVGDTVRIVDWNRYPGGRLVVYSISDKGCISDTLRTTVRIDSPVIRIRRVSTLEINDSVIVIEWDTAQMAYHDTYARLYKWEGGRWITPVRVPVKHRLGHIDEAVRTHSFYYDYRLEGRNLCDQPVRSLTHRSILLQGAKQDEFNVLLRFNRYRGWPVDTYQVWIRTADHTTPVLIAETSDTFVTLEVVNYPGYEKCFRVVAIADTGGWMSYSNWWCERFEAYLWVPNAFSPNGDGVNDTFSIVGGNFRMYRMEIYNRWGERVFRTDDPRAGWDGTWRGREAPEGAYLVVIVYQGGGAPRLFRQWLQLLR